MTAYTREHLRLDELNRDIAAEEEEDHDRARGLLRLREIDESGPRLPGTQYNDWHAERAAEDYAALEQTMTWKDPGIDPDDLPAQDLTTLMELTRQYGSMKAVELWHTAKILQQARQEKGQ